MWTTASDNILETINVKNIPSKITKITNRVATSELPIPCILPATKIVAIDIKNGNLPVTWNKVVC